MSEARHGTFESHFDAKQARVRAARAEAEFAAFHDVSSLAWCGRSWALKVKALIAQEGPEWERGFREEFDDEES